MEALQKLYSLVHPNIQNDIDYYIRHNGRISEHNYEFCDKHTFNDCYFSKIFVFSKQSVFNKKMDEYNKSPNIRTLYHGGMGMGVYHHIWFNIDTKMYSVNEGSDGQEYTICTTTNWTELCEKLDLFFQKDKKWIAQSKHVNG